MKTTEPDHNDQGLRKLLKLWRTDAPLPPGFQEGVWRRIERRQTQAAPSAWATIAHWIGTVLPRPVLAASYVTLLLAIGVTGGWTQARHETARVKDELGQRYVRML